MKILCSCHVWTKKKKVYREEKVRWYYFLSNMLNAHSRQFNTNCYLRANNIGNLRYWQRTTSTVKHYGTLWTTECKSFRSKSSFATQNYGVLYAFFHDLYFYVDSIVRLNKFTFSHEHTFNRRNQDYAWKSSILCPQSKSRTVACNPQRNAKLNRQFLALNNPFLRLK